MSARYKKLVLSGGSTRGISLIGAVHRLVQSGLLDLKNLDTIVGTSAGSLFGCLLVLGFSTDEIWDFMLKLDLKKMVKPDFFMFFKKCGVETGKTFYHLYEDVLSKKTGIKNITFKQLFTITKIRFVVVGSCLTTKETVYYDYLNTPDFKVALAIRISIGIPGFFTPVTVDGKKYIDGGLLNNYAMDFFLDPSTTDSLHDVIGVLICNEYNTNYQYPEEYFMAVINLFMHQYYHTTCEKYIDNTIYVKQQLETPSTFDFDIDEPTKKQLFNAGILATDDFLYKCNGYRVIEGDF